MKYCLDCKWYQEGVSICISPKHKADLVTGVVRYRDARLNRYQYEMTGCGESAQWFEPKTSIEGDK